VRKPFATTVLTLAVGVLGACDDSGSSAPRATPAKSAARKAKPDAGTPSLDAASPSAPIATQVVYTYNPLGKRDPFRSPEELRRASAGEGNAPCKEPLCQWDLSQLQLKAVVTGDANPFAMLEDPQGAGHIVRRNTRVGRQGGRVTQILRDSITVTEYFTQPDGKRAAMPQDVKMDPDKGFIPAKDLVTGATYE
jgi:type IV pilus assembly protein PilP